MGEITFFDWEREKEKASSEQMPNPMIPQNQSTKKRLPQSEQKGKLRGWEEKVTKYLSLYPELRNSDEQLFNRICNDIAISLDMEGALTLRTVLFDRRFPRFETIRRTRQKIQEHNRFLRPDKETEEARKENEIEYKSYALGI